MHLPFTPSELVKRCKAAEARKQPWLSIFDQAYQYSMPHRNTFFNKTKGQKKNAEVYDDTAVIGVQKFTSRMQSTLIPPWQNWTKYSAGSDIPEGQKEEVEKGLQRATEVFFRNLHHSNFAQQSHEAMMDLAIGTGAILFNEGDDDQIFEFTAVPLVELALEEGPAGTVDTVWRRVKVVCRSIKQVWKDFDESTLSQEHKKDPNKEIEFIEGTVFDPDTKIYHYVVLSEKEKGLHVHRPIEGSSPWIVFRWTVAPGEVYGRGPIISSLPTILTANKVVEFTLRNAAMAISGVYTGVSDGVLNPYTARFVPNTILPVASNDNRNPSLRPLERSGDFNVAQLILSELRESINQSLFAERLGPIEGPTKSATELVIRNQELAKDIGSSFGRLQTELVEKVIRRGTEILQRRGKLPPFSVDGREVTLKHESPLARLQDQETMVGISQSLEIVGAMGPEVAALGYKLEDLPWAIGNLLGMPAKLMRTEDERKELKDLIVQIASQQQA